MIGESLSALGVAKTCKHRIPLIPYKSPNYQGPLYSQSLCVFPVSIPSGYSQWVFYDKNDFKLL